MSVYKEGQAFSTFYLHEYVFTEVECSGIVKAKVAYSRSRVEGDIVEV